MSLSGVTPGARRANALVRDERRVRELDALEGPMYDAATEVNLRARLGALLETVETIADDDEFWSTVATSSAALGKEQFERLRDLDSLTLTQLLELAGYEAPPPAEELVGDTLSAVTACRARYAAGVDTSAAVAAVRSDLDSLLYRVRRDLGTVERQTSENAVRTGGRRLVRVARALIPPVVGVALGAPVELLLPGTGLGVLAGTAAARKAIEMSTEWAAASMLGHKWTGDDDALQDAPVERRSPVNNPIVVHTTALVDNLGQLMQEDTKTSPMSCDRREALLADALGHAFRLVDLAEDRSLVARDDPVWSELIGALESTQVQLRLSATSGIRGDARHARAVVFRVQDQLLSGDDHNAGRGFG